MSIWQSRRTQITNVFFLLFFICTSVRYSSKHSVFTFCEDDLVIATDYAADIVIVKKKPLNRFTHARIDMYESTYLRVFYLLNSSQTNKNLVFDSLLFIIFLSSSIQKYIYIFCISVLFFSAFLFFIYFLLLFAPQRITFI